MGGKKWGRKWNSNATNSDLSEDITILKPATKSILISNNASKNRRNNSSRPKRKNRTEYLEFLALPNLHVVAGVLKDHFKTLDQNHVQRLEHLIDQIKTKRDECLPKPPLSKLTNLTDNKKIHHNHHHQKVNRTKIMKASNRMENKRNCSNNKNEDEVIEIFNSNLAMIKSDDESYSWGACAMVPLPYLNINTNLQTKSNECQTEMCLMKSNSFINDNDNKTTTDYKSVNTSCVNLIDVGTVFPELKQSKEDVEDVINNEIKTKTSLDSLETTKMIATHHEPIVVPSVRFIETGGDSFYSCSTELSNFSSKLIVIKICLSDASNDISVDCKLTNKKIERSLPLKVGERLNGIYRLFESYKQSLIDLLTMTDFFCGFKYIYLCLLGIVEVFWTLYLKSLNLNLKPCCLRLKNEEEKNKAKNDDDLLVSQVSDSISAPKLKKFKVKRNYGRKREEIVEIFRVSNVCSILG